MNEVLEAFKDIKQAISLLDFAGSKDKQWMNDNLRLVETRLKALEIIKNKKVWVAYLLKCATCEDYNNGIFDFGKENHLTQKEYDLLKEVLL